MILRRLNPDIRIAIAIFAITLIIFLISRIHQASDSAYSMLVSHSLLTRGSIALEHYALPRYDSEWNGDHFKHGPIYQLERIDNHIYYHFPPGTSFLSVPFVAAFKLAGISTVNADGTYNLRNEVRIQAALAAFLMAVLASLFFLTARLLLPTAWSIIIALGGALGTQVYSTASRALWSDTWGILLLAVVIYFVLAAEVGKRRLKPVLIASLLAWTYFVRPTFVVPIVAITVYLVIFYRQIIPKYIATGTTWFILFMLYSWIHYHHFLPSYYRANRLQFDLFWTALAGNLISPARGLLVYVPTLLFVGYLLIRYRRRLVRARLVWLSIVVVAIHIILISGFNHWWGGHSFGPRFTTGLVPWFVLLAILGIKAMLDSRQQQAAGRFRPELICGGVLLLISAFINTVGATSHAAWLWNQRPRGVDEHPERLWDWRQPQFLAGYLPYPGPDAYPPIGFQRIDFSKADAEKYFWYGWNEGPTDSRWSDNKAAIAFTLEGKPSQLLIDVTPYVVPGKLDEQKLQVEFNGEPIGTAALRTSQLLTLSIPAGLVKEQNIVIFELPNAQSPLSLKSGEDPRWRGMKINWLEFR
jgi:hypothetical protein